MNDKNDVRGRNINENMMTAVSPALDLTRKFVGFTPRETFKRSYLDSIKKTDQQLLDYLEKNHDKLEPQRVVAYIYDARRRGLQAPLPVRERYNEPGEAYLRDLNVISAEPAEKYVGTSIATAGALTGIAGLDYLEEALRKRNPINEKAWEAAARKPAEAAGAVIPGKGEHVYKKVFKYNLSELLGGENTKKSKFLARLIGTSSYVPLLGLAALPLMSRRVLKPLKGEDKESKRYKTFNWIERNPGKTMAISFAPSVINAAVGGGVDMRTALRESGKGLKAKLNTIAGSAGRTGITLGKLGLTAAVPIMYMQMRRNMTDAREQERALINRTILKNNINQGSEKKQ